MTRSLHFTNLNQVEYLPEGTTGNRDVQLFISSSSSFLISNGTNRAEQILPSSRPLPAFENYILVNLSITSSLPQSLPHNILGQ